ncbi:MAG: T9SS type A sorting domain-containing protein [Chitinophagaceae bacterium]|nr:T9SS type A sorting domain-containing protein [Chitinophagaceae bacterium]
MKSKFIHSSILFIGLSVIFITMKSDVNGKYNNGTTCGSCHGSTNNATTVSIVGLPSTFITNQSYPLTFVVSNSSLPKAGFNIAVSGGTFTAGSGSKTNGAANQITHTAPATATSGISTFSFNWTAPSTTASVTFNGVGNAVNDDNNDSNVDQWNTTTNTISGANPSELITIEKNIRLNCFPNPTTNFITFENLSFEAKNLHLYNLNGQKISAPYIFVDKNCIFNVQHLNNGVYMIHAEVNNKMVVASFIKQ